MASSVRVSSSSRLQPSMSAPRWITSREQPAAKAGVLNFFLTDLSSRSLTLFDGKNAAAFERENGVWKRVNAPSGILADIMAALRGVVAGGEISGGVFDSSKQADGSVVLVPRDAALRKFIEKIVVELKDGTREPRKVVIFDAGGDRTELAVRKYISGGIDLSGFFDLSAPQSAKIGRFLGK